jgi:NADPH2:quinone reductase
VSRPEILDEPVRLLLDMIRDGSLRAVVGGTYPLAEAGRAHEDIRARRTTGKLVLDPRG